ncbi:MAG TPA: hypothetical protein VM266_01620 [Solirubrobacteraceae bacterium]|nr:hypothetical protein [Solirubrobacteraceae bacterium]
MPPAGIQRIARAITVAAAAATALVAVAPADGEQIASDVRRLEARFLGAGILHTCAILETGRVRCWGAGAGGRLGYGNSDTIGDDEAPAAVRPVDLGPGRTATAITVGAFHACAALDTGQVRCWGESPVGQLGYGNTERIGDDETPAAAGPVDLGPGRTATAITAGRAHTCAILDTGDVHCWGSGGSGQLGYGNTETIGDDETPASAGPVDLGTGRTATAISAGNEHTCAILDTGDVRCWGLGYSGRLGYGNTTSVGIMDSPAAAGPVDLGPGRTATAITAAFEHTCAILDTGRVRCWGGGGAGCLGYGNTDDIGDDETPAAVEPLDLGGLALGRLADLSLSVTAPASVYAGDAYDATVVIRNDGPDATSGVVVAAPAPAGTTLGRALAEQGTYNATTHTWYIDVLAPGAVATLTLAVRAGATGNRSQLAEVIVSDIADPDSTPGNGDRDEDDFARATTAVLAAGPTGPTTTTTGAQTTGTQTTGTPTTGTLTLWGKPRRGKRAVRARGKLALPAGTPPSACAGAVTITLKSGRKRLARRDAQLHPPTTGSACTFATTLELERPLRQRQKLTFTARLPATATLAAAGATLKRTVRR